MIFACCVTCPTLTFTESTVEKPFLQAHGEVDCVVIAVMLSHFASDLTHNAGSNRLTKILQFQEVVLKSKKQRIIFLETPVTWLTLCLVNRRHSRRRDNLFDSFPLLLTKVKELADGRKAEGATCKLVGCQLTKTCCIKRQLVDLLCIWSIGALCVAIPFRDGLLAGVGIFLPPLEEVLPKA